MERGGWSPEGGKSRLSQFRGGEAVNLQTKGTFREVRKKGPVGDAWERNNKRQSVKQRGEMVLREIKTSLVFGKEGEKTSLESATKKNAYLEKPDCAERSGKGARERTEGFY